MEQVNNNYDRLAIIKMDEDKARKIFNFESEYDFKSLPINKNLLNKKIYIYSSDKGKKAILGYAYIDEVIKGNLADMTDLAGNDSKAIEKIINMFTYKMDECYALHFSDPVEFDQYLYADIITLMKEKGLLHNFFMKNYITHVSHRKHRNLYNLLEEWDKEFSLDGNGISDSPQITKKRILKKVFD